MMSPAGRVLRRQGWKLHLSATPASAVDLLERALPVLLANRCAAKFPADLEWAAWLNSPRCPRGTAGKFLTAYPDDDEHFRRLAEALHEATTGLVGPQILSDRRYRPDSIVYYRFGAFVNEMVLDDDGRYRPVVVDPAGRVVEDRRHPWFAPPGWAVPVLPHAAQAPLAGPSRPVLLAGRFVVRQAIRHSSRGGVFLGTDLLTGASVLVKQARAHMELDRSGRDCRHRLRSEATLLNQLAPRGLAPRVIAVVDQADDLFLVREAVDGITVRRWVGRHFAGGGVPLEPGLAMARAVVRLVDTVHRSGIVLVDVSPDNFMVDSAGVLWLTDLDHAAGTGEPIDPVGTPGYTPPEHLSGRRSVAARPAADLFGLGGLLFLIAMGTAPSLLADEPPGRPVRARLAAWLDTAGADLPLADRLRDAVAGLTHERPGARWRLGRVMRYLDHTGPPSPPRPVRTASRPRRAALDQTVDQLIDDWVADSVARMNPAGGRLWQSTPFGTHTDPCSVQHGAAGVLATLVRAAPLVADQDRIRAAVAMTCGWIEGRLSTGERVLPGLYFGRSGTAWALYEAAMLLDDPRLAASALDLAVRVPVVWGNPDVAHGAAGAGLMLLHLWSATGDRRLPARIRACADGLVAAAVDRDGTVLWPISAALRSTLAGRTFYGYAHGSAGVGAFLLAAGVASSRPEYLRLAERTGDALIATAVLRDGMAFWPVGPDGAGAGTGDAGWCKGSAGIGGFLLQLWQVTRRQRCLDLARAAAAAAYRSRVHLPTVACHGLAGVGHLLLELADELGEETYRCWARDLAQVMAARAAHRRGRLLLPDETGQDVAADYGTGLAGCVDFLVRLRHAGGRPWTVDPHDVRAIGARVPQDLPQTAKGAGMSTAQTEPTHDPAALQQLPETGRSPDEEEDPGCATTGVTYPVPGPDLQAVPTDHEPQADDPRPDDPRPDDPRPDDPRADDDRPARPEPAADRAA